MTTQPHTGSHATIATRLTQLWDISVPIIGAPMAGRAGGELAAAVSRAGGLGMFGVAANASAQWVTQQAHIARQLSIPGAQSGSATPATTQEVAPTLQQPHEAQNSHNTQERGAQELGNFGIGVMLWAIKNQPEVWQAVLDARPKVISMGFGDPNGYVEEAHEQGISVVAPVNDIAQLKQALAAEVDVVCIQGTDAGGHTGYIGTMPLMQMVLDHLVRLAPGIPACVAGGIGTGRGVAAVLAAGADAAWIGTALLASPEAIGSEELRIAALNASARSTLLTDIYDRAEQQPWDTATWPTRTVGNAFTDAYAEASRRGEASDEELVSARAAGGLFASEPKLHAGQGVGMLQVELPAQDVVEQMIEDAYALLNRTL